MSQVDFVVNAEVRSDMGKGASRRLRRDGVIPAIVYGGGQAPVNLLVNHNELYLHLQHEAFYSHILTLKVNGKDEQVVLKDLQRHPAKPVVLHADFQRVSATEKLRMHVPLHFVGADVAPGVKVGGGLVTHNLNEVEVLCLAKDLPEFIEVDLSQCEVGQSIHLSDLKLPAGVELVELIHGGAEHDLPVAAIQAARGGAGGEAAAEAAAE